MVVLVFYLANVSLPISVYLLLFFMSLLYGVLDQMTNFLGIIKLKICFGTLETTKYFLNLSLWARGVNL